MKIVFLITVCFGLTAADSPISEQWKSFKAEHKKKYASAYEENLRMSIFRENIKEIEEHNAKYAKGEVAYSLKINKFGDLSPEEFSAKFNGYQKNSPTTNSNLGQKFEYPLNANLPNSMDWRNIGAVTAVKSQGTCNGCWSFSATGAMEGQLFINTGNLIALSEQQLIDCSSFYGNKGCNGGRMESAFQYLKEAGGIASENNYPFLGMDGKCIFSNNLIVNGTKVTSYTELPDGDEDALKAAVATVGPVSVAVKAGSRKFMYYEKGILTSDGCGTQLTHAVLVVGYGTESNVDFWIVKNSWSTKWGEDGYVRIARNQGNACGLATFPSYPTLEKSASGNKTTVAPPTGKPTPTNAGIAVLSSENLLLACLFFIYSAIKIGYI
ncbi:unnamed protein product [Nezara viridula]|uniref:Uncharacterized protein n=1 Tax=Nezara viridula TaxID=85310 RepID=A0A9P0E8S8_NEZVI|nr:unnamed protein product [Nezara viridula]